MLGNVHTVINTIERPINELRRTESLTNYVVNCPRRMITLWANIKACFVILCPCNNNNQLNQDHNDVPGIDLVGDVHYNHYGDEIV